MKKTFWTRFTKLIFERLQVSGPGATSYLAHSIAVCEIFGPGCLQLYGDVEPVLQILKTRKFRLALISNWHRGLDFFCR